MANRWQIVGKLANNMRLRPVACNSIEKPYHQAFYGVSLFPVAITGITPEQKAVGSNPAGDAIKTQFKRVSSENGGTCLL